MAVPFKIRILDLCLKLFTDTFVFRFPFQTAGAIPSFIRCSFDNLL